MKRICMDSSIIRKCNSPYMEVCDGEVRYWKEMDDRDDLYVCRKCESIYCWNGVEKIFTGDNTKEHSYKYA